MRPLIFDRSRVLAVLGPTNTGKTHFAVERMLAHSSGLMGFPLRLLAREVYDRIVALRGPECVALITGEEKRAPKGARYFICTTEAMPEAPPGASEVAFLAVDEIQLCADPERGHVFTDRLLRARGAEETVFLGSETIRPLLKRLVPEAEVITRPRFSVLSHAGPSKLTRLPRRSAVVAFRTSDVYRLAEILRRHKGGAAVVLGGLSPRTRNAQVELYQSGEVEHLVATDAIGMGLNMDLAHVAFAAVHKFDGRESRDLHPHEVGQIAGRAGRHMRDGTFGTTTDVGGLDERLVEAVESHEFAPLRALYWRNADLDFTSLNALRAGLDAPPPYPGLVKKRDAVDDMALRMLAGRPEVRERATSRAAVRLLWQVCQVPDFTKVLADNHLHLLARLYDSLSGRGRLPTDWVADKVARLDRVDGDIDTLTSRLAHIRTWTYVAQREDWLDDAAHWRERAQAVEDRLSDALHERLTHRFVDRRTSALLRSMRERHDLPAAVTRQGDVLIDGHGIGRMEGLSFVVDRDSSDDEGRVLHAAARRVLGPEVTRRAAELVRDDDAAFALDDDGDLSWRGHPVGRLVRGASVLTPRVEAVESPNLAGKAREAVAERLGRFVDGYLGGAVRPLLLLPDVPLRGPGRGLAFRLVEGLGNVAAEDVRDLLGALDPVDRGALTRHGVRFGVLSVFLPAMLKPTALTARARLWRLHRRGAGLPPPPPSRVSLPRDATASPADYAAVGFEAFAGCALRLDTLERLAARLRQLCRDEGGFAPDAGFAGMTGLGNAEVAAVIAELGYRREPGETGEVVRFVRPKKPKHRRGRAVKAAADADSPFAVLKELRPSG